MPYSGNHGCGAGQCPSSCPVKTCFKCGPKIVVVVFFLPSGINPKREEETYRQAAREEEGKRLRNWEETPGPAESSGSPVLEGEAHGDCSLEKGLERDLGWLLTVTIYLYRNRLPLKNKLLLDTVRTWLDFSSLRQSRVQGDTWTEPRHRPTDTGGQGAPCKGYWKLSSDSRKSPW